MRAKVIKLISNIWTVQVNNELYDCSCIGKFKYLNITPKVGDLVDIDETNKIITKIYERNNELVRPPISNVDYGIILTSCKEPLFSSLLLDKMIAIISYNNIIPVICFTKYDLLNNTKEIDEYIKYYKSIGYNVFINSELNKIKKFTNGKISVLTGQTGVGKSSLLNNLKKDLNLPTNEISKALGRGKHTTRHVELLDIEGSLIADTPGFSSIDFTSMTIFDIKDNFVEIFKHGQNCKYKDCFHIKEDGCNVKKKVDEGVILKSRYENYRKIIESVRGKK